MFLYGSNYDGVPEVRYTFTVVDIPNDVHIFEVASAVTNPDSAFEVRTP